MASQDDYIKTALRLPRELHASIKLAAEKAGRSFNAELIARLQDSMLETGIKNAGAAQALAKFLSVFLSAQEKAGAEGSASIILTNTPNGEMMLQTIGQKDAARILESTPES